MQTVCLFICFENFPTKLCTNPHLGACLRLSFLLPTSLAPLWSQPKPQGIGNSNINSTTNSTNIDRLANPCQALWEALETQCSVGSSA